MGTFNVSVEVAAGPNGPFEAVELLAGTRAAFSLVPSAVLQCLGVEPAERHGFIAPGGNRVERGVGWGAARIGEECASTPFVFGEGADEPVLGHVTLTGCGLQADPEEDRLIPATFYLPGVVLAPDAEREAV